jgi:hypothetical protein
MTQSWIAALSSKLKGCWNPPIGARDAGALVVTVGFNLLPDGSLAGDPGSCLGCRRFQSAGRCGD